MHVLVAALILLIATAGTSCADGRTATFFSDGALVEVEVSAVKGIAEIALPAGVLENSLRVKPVGNAVIRQVNILPARQREKRAKELDQLLEQKSRLEDRLKALSTREEVFKSAAKSQSGKAPRKTKANPDPMQSIRQGTEFAIAQLEAVYTAQRKTEQDIRRLDSRINAVRKSEHGIETVAQIILTPNNAKARVRYFLAGQGWKPRYDLRLNGPGVAMLTLNAELPGNFGGYLLKASPGTIDNIKLDRVIPASAGSLARLAEYRLPVRDEIFENGVRSSFSFVLTNSSDTHLLPGEASFYRSGEYWGRFRFEGISSGRNRQIRDGISSKSKVE